MPIEGSALEPGLAPENREEQESQYCAKGHGARGGRAHEGCTAVHAPRQVGVECRVGAGQAHLDLSTKDGFSVGDGYLV